MKLNTSQKELHQRAVAVCRDLNSGTWKAIEILQELEQAKLFKWFECSSLFVFATDHLNLDRELAYQLITAARRCKEIPALGESIKLQRLTLGKAVRIFSTLNPENADHLISYAESHTTDEINREVSRIRKEAGLPEKLRNLKVSDETYAKVKRAKSVMTKSGKGKVDQDVVVSLAMEEFLERHDPVRKAARAAERKKRRAETQSARAGDDNGAGNDRATAGDGSADGRGNVGETMTDKSEVIYAAAPSKESDEPLTTGDAKLCTYRVSRRETLTAEQRHEVILAKGGRCTHVDNHNRRCGNDRYLHIHPVSLGGSNDPENLTILCSYHHDLVHQLSFPIEGQRSWLRSPVSTYSAEPRRRH